VLAIFLKTKGLRLEDGDLETLNSAVCWKSL
jgi:hypothetical protein